MLRNDRDGPKLCHILRLTKVAVTGAYVAAGAEGCA